MKTLIELQYLPSIAYFSVLRSSENIIVEKFEHFIKQSYRNRCHILTAQGIQRLIVPITSKSARMNRKDAYGKVLITDVRIDYSQKWLNNHWRAIESAYRNAPFFEFYADDLRLTLFRQHTFLYDLNFELLTICLRWLKLDIPIQETMAYEKIPSGSVIDVRNVIQAKKTEQLASFFQPVTYAQVFGNTFVEGLSLIDLVFCEGPNAYNVVGSSAKLH